MTTGLQTPALKLTSTQIGAIGEAIVATGLMLTSDGRLSPYRPIADDDGTDLLIVDKQTRRVIPIQVKSRTKVDDPRAERVQFDVRLKTFAEDGKGFILAVLLDGAELRAAWLIPSGRLAEISAARPEKRIIVASAKTGAKDQCRQFRHDNFKSVARAILEEPVTPL